MNQNVASYPSVLGVPDCIEERVSFDASLAQVVGSSARWSSYESRYQSGIVTGSAFLTPELRAWRESHASTFVSLALGRAFRCTLTQWEPRADSQGRAIVSYASLLVETYYLPRPDALVCLYVPRWQTEHGDVLYDLSGNNRHMTLTNASYDSEGNLVNNNSRGIWRGNAGTIRDYTIVANRQLREAHVGEQYGFLLSWRNNNATVAMETRQSNEDRCKSLGIVTHNITYPNYDGWAYQRTADYCGQPIGHGTQYRLDYGVSFSGVSNRMAWLTVRSVAAWSVSLTDLEIQVAQMYLAQRTRPTDI